MDRLTDKINENQTLAATTQAQLRNERRTVRRNLTPAIPKTRIFPQDHDGEEGGNDEIDDETSVVSVPVLSEHMAPSPASMPLAHTAATLAPLDLPADQFRSGLDRRKQNRQLLLDWLRTALVVGVDFGPVHIASKDRCEHARAGRVKECTNPYHWSKPSLFKPGAEKITGMLGMTVHYPSLVGYENAFVSGHDVKQIMLRCELHDAHGRVVAEGVGARSLAQDYGDINKAFKMAEKSAHIDATLRLAGLSEVFTQDLEDSSILEHDDMPPPPDVTSSQRPAATRPRSPAPPPPPPPPASAPAPASAPTSPDIEIIGAKDVAAIKKRIASIGITEKRVLAWVYKVTRGTVTRFDQLNVTQSASLLKRLSAWAEEETNPARAAK